jgi:hypothetical protein
MTRLPRLSRPEQLLGVQLSCILRNANASKQWLTRYPGAFNILTLAGWLAVGPELYSWLGVLLLTFAFVGSMAPANALSAL